MDQPSSCALEARGMLAGCVLDSYPIPTILRSLSHPAPCYVIVTAGAWLRSVLSQCQPCLWHATWRRAVEGRLTKPGVRALHRPYAVSPWSVVSSSSMVWASRHPTGRAACMCCSWGRCRVLSNLAGSPVIGRMEGVSKTQRAGPPNHCRQYMVQ